VHCAWGFSATESSVCTIKLTQSHKDANILFHDLNSFCSELGPTLVTKFVLSY
jgi:hypothetical protein